MVSSATRIQRPFCETFELDHAIQHQRSTLYLYPHAFPPLHWLQRLTLCYLCWLRARRTRRILRDHDFRQEPFATYDPVSHLFLPGRFGCRFSTRDICRAAIGHKSILRKQANAISYNSPDSECAHEFWRRVDNMGCRVLATFPDDWEKSHPH